MEDILSGENTYKIKKEESKIVGVIKLGTACNLCEHNYVDERYSQKDRYCLAYGEGPYVNSENGRVWWAYEKCWIINKGHCLSYYSKEYPVKFSSWFDRIWRWLYLEKLHQKILRRGRDYTYEAAHERG